MLNSYKLKGCETTAFNYGSIQEDIGNTPQSTSFFGIQKFMLENYASVSKFFLYFFNDFVYIFQSLSLKFLNIIFILNALHYFIFHRHEIIQMLQLIETKQIVF